MDLIFSIHEKDGKQFIINYEDFIPYCKNYCECSVIIFEYLDKKFCINTDLLQSMLNLAMEFKVKRIRFNGIWEFEPPFEQIPILILEMEFIIWKQAGVFERYGFPENFYNNMVTR